MSQRVSPLYRRSLGIEQLDQRLVPAVLLTPHDLDGDGGVDDIRIVGDAQHSTVSIQDDGTNKLLISIDANSNGSLLDKGDLQQQFTFTGNSVVVEVFLGAGKDTFNYTPTSTLGGDTRNFFVNLGSGNDTFNWNMNNNTINASSRIGVELWTGDGHDQANVTFGTISNAYVSMFANMGNHNDTYNLTLGPVDQKATVDVTTDLGHGNNLHKVSIDDVGKFDKAYVNMNILGGNHVDTVEVKLLDDVGDGQTASRLNLDVNLQNGNDLFEAILNADFRVDDHSQATLKVRGGNGNDQLTAKSDGNGQLKLDADSLLGIDFDGGAGNDGLNVGIFPIIQGTTLDLYGTMQVRMAGGAGNDKLLCLFANTNTSTGSYDIVLKGDAGNDQTQFGITNSGAAAITLGPGAGVLIDGGQGQDQLTSSSPAYVVSKNNEVTV